MRKTSNIIMILTILIGGLEILIGMFDKLNISEVAQNWIIYSVVALNFIVNYISNYNSGKEIKELKRQARI